MKDCLLNEEFNALMVAIKEKESILQKQIFTSKRLKIPTQAREALNRLIEAKLKLYFFKCKS